MGLANCPMGGGPKRFSMTAYQQLSTSSVSLQSNIRRFVEVFVMPPKIYRWPRRSRVLIFDASWTDLLLLFLKPWTPEILHLRQECINVPCLLRAALNRNFWNGDMVTASIDAFIRYVQPDLVITMIDNDVRFYTLSQRHPQIKIVAIQNGVRGSEEFNGLNRAIHEPPLQCSHCCVFGANIEQEYRIFSDHPVVLIGQLKKQTRSQGCTVSRSEFHRLRVSIQNSVPK